jgi:MFS family permease
MLPDSPLARRLTWLSALYSGGYGIFMAGGPVFLTRWLGLSPNQVAAALSVAAVAALVLTVPIGAVIDRLGPRRTWLLATIVQAVGYAGYPVIRGFVAVVLLAALIAVVETAGTLARQTYTAGVFPPAERVRVMAFVRSAGNAGLTIGALLASAALATQERWAYPALVFGNAVVLLVVAIVVAALPPVRASTPTPRRRALYAVRDYPFMAVSGLSGVLLCHASILSVVLPLWILSRTDAPDTAVTVCFALNTVLTVLLQVRAARGSETIHGAARAQRRAGVLLAAMCLVLAVTQYTTGWSTLTLLGTGVVLLTAGELWHSAGSWTVSVDLAPEDKRGEYLSAFRLGGQLQTVLAPIGLTALVVTGGTIGWMALAVILTVTGAAVVPVAGWAQRAAADRTAQPIGVLR